MDFNGRYNIYINVFTLSETIFYEMIIQPLPQYWVYFHIHVKKCFYI